jgi:hypothetical protein
MENLFYFIEALLLMVYLLFLVWEYSGKDVPLYIQVLTYFSWLFTFSAILVLPIDIANVKK